jgi:hypothetical protein
MTTELITNKKENINWDKVMLVRFKTTNGEKIVLTNGKHSKEEFSGTLLVDTMSGDPQIGEYINAWAKDCFTPLTGTTVISFNVD